MKKDLAAGPRCHVTQMHEVFQLVKMQCNLVVTCWTRTMHEVETPEQYIRRSRLQQSTLTLALGVGLLI